MPDIDTSPALAVRITTSNAISTLVAHNSDFGKVPIGLRLRRDYGVRHHSRDKDGGLFVSGYVACEGADCHIESVPQPVCLKLAERAA